MTVKTMEGSEQLGIFLYSSPFNIELQVSTYLVYFFLAGKHPEILFLSVKA